MKREMSKTHRRKSQVPVQEPTTNPPPRLPRSREIALQNFSLQIKNTIQKCPIYIDPFLDTVFPINITTALIAQLVNIRHLAVSVPRHEELGPKCHGGPPFPCDDPPQSRERLIGRLRTLPHLIDLVFIFHETRCLLHIESQFQTMEFSHLGDFEWDIRVLANIRALEAKARVEGTIHPEWKMPNFLVKGFDIPDGKLLCQEE